jgi:uncharacterized protein YlaN (UPF0358 family)
LDLSVSLENLISKTLYKKTMPQTPIQLGTRFIETLWYALATRIVDRAIELYQVDEERAQELKEKFLKRGEYQVTVLNRLSE